MFPPAPYLKDSMSALYAPECQNSKKSVSSELRRHSSADPQARYSTGALANTKRLSIGEKTKLLCPRRSPAFHRFSPATYTKRDQSYNMDPGSQPADSTHWQSESARRMILPRLVIIKPGELGDPLPIGWSSGPCSSVLLVDFKSIGKAVLSLSAKDGSAFPKLMKLISIVEVVARGAKREGEAGRDVG